MTRAAILAFVLVASPAAADGFEDARACLAEQMTSRASAMICIETAHAECLAMPAGEAAGAACFVDAKERWGEQIAGRMAEIAETASDEIQQIASIETKYALRGALMNCDRLEELTLVRQDPDMTTVYARARCEAQAVAASYFKLLVQSGAL